ncbi:GL17982 [Drosophila persimilis]|uniref:GL17982 n=1 Tax=Drosophila persimilis TaxID=7234 RepID=B4H207_DROPE|nr:GL17982 [Drosophila persimilis]
MTKGHRYVLNFSDGSLPIQGDYPDPRIFSNGSSYGDRVPGLSWNEFFIHHLGQLEYLENPKQVILEAIFDVIDGEEFYPVAYDNSVVSLANVATLKHVCSSIYHNDETFSAVNGFIFANNHMKSVDPLKLFGDVEYGLVDLSENKIASSVRLWRELKRVRAKELKLANVPITMSSKYPNSIKALQGNFSMVDGIPHGKLHSTYTPLKHDIDLESTAYALTGQKNRSWLILSIAKIGMHFWFVPDPMHALTETNLFTLFFITTNQFLSEIYPCYYKFDGKEHIFLVHNCFEQIAYLVHSCNLEIQIHETVPKVEDPDVCMGPRTIPFYMRMNVSRFKLHNVDPQERITKCIQKCYVAQNRLLKMSDFQATEGLKGLWVHMGSTRILNNILTIISRQYMSNCSEIRLCNNNILRIDAARVLSRMWSLDIKALGELPLKSLRLHGNPLCRKYIQAVKEIFPQLTTLDGVDLSSKPGQVPQKNFLCDIGANELVGDVFLSNYLHEFEQADMRANRLMKYYTENSIFTMTSNYTDVMHYNGQLAVIHLTGLMRDDSPSTHNQAELYLAFTRNFVLKVDKEGLVQDAFKVCPLRRNRLNAPASKDSLDAKSHKLIFFLQLTGLTPPWCTRIVESAEWDFERASKMFLEMKNNREIPELAFV